MTGTKMRPRPSRTKKVGAKPAAKGHTAAKKAPRGGKARKAGPTPAKAKARRVTRETAVLEMLRGPNGVSIDEMVAAFGIQPHTARAMISVFSRRAGLTALLEDTRYRAARV